MFLGQYEIKSHEEVDGKIKVELEDKTLFLEKDLFEATKTEEKDGLYEVKKINYLSRIVFGIFQKYDLTIAESQDVVDNTAYIVNDTVNLSILKSHGLDLNPISNNYKSIISIRDFYNKAYN